jgi:hypothetical protein
MGASNSSTLVVIVGIAIAYYLYFLQHDNNQQILEALERNFHSGRAKNCSKVSVAYNANLDLIVNWDKLSKQLQLIPSEKPNDHEKIQNLQELEETFSYFFQHGSAAERFVEDIEVFKIIVEVSKNYVHLMSSRNSLGDIS